MHRSDPASYFVARAATALLALALASPAVAVDVTACGQTVSHGEIGDLVTDLSCTGGGIGLENGATLRLNGHVIAGPTPTSSCHFPDCGGVWCQGARCTVEGPGEVTGFPFGIWSQDPARLRRQGGVTATDVLLRGNNIGVRAEVARLSAVVARENVIGLIADSLRLENVEASANSGEGILGQRLRGIDVRVEDNSSPMAGIVVGRARLRQATVTGNGGDGVRTTTGLSMRDSVVTDNAGVDVSCPRRPRVLDTTCGSSSNQASGDWDVCTND